MSSQLSLSSSSKYEELSLKNIYVLVDSKKQPWFKQAHIGPILEGTFIPTSATKLKKENMESQDFFQEEGEASCMELSGDNAPDYVMFFLYMNFFLLCYNPLKLYEYTWIYNILTKI